MSLESMPHLAQLAKICRLWRLRFARPRPALLPAGSPGRSLERAMNQEDARRLFVFERLAQSASM